MKSSPLNLFKSLSAGVGTELLKISCIGMIQQLRNFQAFALCVQNIKQKAHVEEGVFLLPTKKPLCSMPRNERSNTMHHGAKPLNN